MLYIPQDEKSLRHFIASYLEIRPVLSTFKSFSGYFQVYVCTVVKSELVLYRRYWKGGRFTRVPGGEGMIAQLTDRVSTWLLQ